MIITLDGIHTSGKSTQCQILSQLIKNCIIYPNYYYLMGTKEESIPNINIVCEQYIPSILSFNNFFISTQHIFPNLVEITKNIIEIHDNKLKHFSGYHFYLDIDLETYLQRRHERDNLNLEDKENIKAETTYFNYQKEYFKTLCTEELLIEIDSTKDILTTTNNIITYIKSIDSCVLKSGVVSNDSIEKEKTH